MDKIRSTAFSHCIRNASSKTKDSKSKEYLSSMSKVVFLFIYHYKRIFPDRTPSYHYMMNRYGVNHATYNRSLKELENFGVITTEVIDYKKNGLLRIKLNKTMLDSYGFEMIPNVIINTDVYTNTQKLFIAMIWKLFYKKRVEKGSMAIYLSNTKIISELSDKGFSKPSVIKLLRELSDASYGWIPLLIKTNKGYELDSYAMIAIASRLDDSWEEAKHILNTKYPIYQKPEPFDFSYRCDSEAMRITEHRVERTPAIIKKLSKGDDTYEEAKERFDNANFEEYEGQ